MIELAKLRFKMIKLEYFPSSCDFSTKNLTEVNHRYRANGMNLKPLNANF